MGKKITIIIEDTPVAPAPVVPSYPLPGTRFCPNGGGLCYCTGACYRWAPWPTTIYGQMTSIQSDCHGFGTPGTIERKV